jgi:hypothetical protein
MGLRVASDHLARASILRAVVPPARLIFGVVEPVELVSIVIQAVGGRLSLVVVPAVVARRRFLLGTLTSDVELLAGELHNLFQRLFEIHFFPPGPMACR